MMSIIPLAAWGFFFGFVRKKGFDWRVAFLATSVAWGMTLTFLTELLGFFEILNRPFVAAGWGVVSLAAGCLFFRAGGSPKGLSFRNLCQVHRLMVFAIAAILAGTLIQALVSPPNNFDSMTYHMSRVMHWIQQGSVAHFPTNILRQLELNPWAEFAMTHLQILSGGDHLANLVQWFSMLGCILGVSYVAGLLGAGVRGQLFSAFLAATLPMAVLQATSTQNDLVVSFWLLCFVSFGMLSSKEKSPVWIALMSCSLGLAILTKGTAYVYAFPFMLWFFIQDLKHARRRTLLKYPCIALVLLLVNLGHYKRDYQLFHSPLHSGENTYSNSRVTAAVVLSNVVRNLTIHLLTPSHAINKYTIGAVKGVHSVIGIDMYDPGSTWPGTTFENLRFAPSEDSSGNPLHFCCFTVAFFALVIMRKKVQVSYPLRYAVTVLGGFVLFCAMLRWQPWHGRLHLPMFELFSPLAGLVGELIEAEWLISALTLSFSLVASTWMVLNHSRPMISLSSVFPTHPPSIFSTSRDLLYLNNLPAGNRQSFLAAAQTIKTGNYKNVGLRFDDNSFEYPIWALTRDKDGRGPRIEDVDFHNFSDVIPQKPFVPDIVLYISDDGNVAVRGHR